MTLRYSGALRAGLVFIAATTVVLLVALLINLNFGLPFNLSAWPPGQDYVLNASFKDANGVTRGADVQIAGHTVGQVTGVQAVGDRSIVAMRINQQYAPIHQGSIARIRYSTLLAQKYIELAPVSHGSTIGSGGTIPSTDTITRSSSGSATTRPRSSRTAVRSRTSASANNRSSLALARATPRNM